MKHPSTISAGLACCLALVATSASAVMPGGWGAVLRDMPSAQFNDEEIRLHLETALKALNAPIGTPPAAWHNEATGNGAKFEVLSQPKLAGQTECRRVRGTSYSKIRKPTSTLWTACKDASGRWLVAKVG